MSVIELVLAIAADIRNRDYAKLLQDIIALLQVIGGPTGPGPGTMAKVMGATPKAAVSVSLQPNADALATELEEFAHEHTPEKVAAGAFGAPGAVNWRGLIELIIKVLPLLIR